MAQNTAVIYTDGACKGNPGRGGWAAIIQQNGQRKVVSGNHPQTTNNRMEMMAAIKGLEAVERSVRIVLNSDSTYVVNTMTKGWKRKTNQDLWEQLDHLVADRQVEWRWLKGHNGDPGNELADSVASKEAGLATSSDGNP